MNILVTMPDRYVKASGLLKRLAEQKYQVDYLPSEGELSPETIADRLHNKDAYIVGLDKITKEILQAGNHLKAILKFGVGYDNIDIEAARQLNIDAVNTPGMNAVAVAELTLALMLDSARRVSASDNNMKQKQWQIHMGTELFQKTAGIIGFGTIGKEIAKRLSAVGMHTIAYGNYQDHETANELGVSFVHLDELLSSSDYVILSTSLKPSTNQLIDAEKLNRMKSTAFLINIARGALVDEHALYQALVSGRIYGAALDVFAKEPTDSPLALLPNVICTPHIGAATIESAQRIALDITQNIQLLDQNQPLRNIVNPPIHV